MNRPLPGHWVEFSDISGWKTPDDTNVTIVAGQTTTFYGVYTKQNSSLTVKIEPAAVVSAGAKWRVDEGPWLDSDYTELDLNDGVHTVEFKEISGWMTQEIQTITIVDGEDAVTSAVYTQSGGGSDNSGGGCFIFTINH